MSLLILPDRTQPVGKFLMPLRRNQWQAPSLAQPKDMFGNENCQRWRIRARQRSTNWIVWQGWFDDREDADAFLYALIAGSLDYERALWDLPVETWPGQWSPDMYPDLAYEFASLVFLTTPTGSNQTYTSAVDWNNSNNQVETIASGGSGAARQAPGNAHATGAGAGAWNKILNFTFATPGTTTAVWQTGVGGAGVATPTATSGGTNGNIGNDTWFGGTTIGAASVGSKAGNGGLQVVTGTVNGGLGGVGASGVGTSSNDGGRGGNLTGASGHGGSGAGGAAGSSAAGSQGVDSASTGTAVSTAGGQGDGTTGGLGGPAGSAGSIGTEWDSSHGSGGGGGGLHTALADQTGPAGGAYGSGSGGAQSDLNTGTTHSANASDGIVVLTYTPASTATATPSSGWDTPQRSRRMVGYDAKYAAGWDRVFGETLH